MLVLALERPERGVVCQGRRMHWTINITAMVIFELFFLGGQETHTEYFTLNWRFGLGGLV